MPAKNQNLPDNSKKIQISLEYAAVLEAQDTIQNRIKELDNTLIGLQGSKICLFEETSELRHDVDNLTEKYHILEREVGRLKSLVPVLKTRKK